MLILKKRSLIVLLFIVLTGSSSHLESKSLWKKFKQFQNKNKSKFTEILDNFYVVQNNQIYRSKQLSGKTLQYYIEKYEIKTIINLRGENPGKDWWEKENNVAQNNQINFINIALSAAILPSKENIIKLLHSYDNATGPILIHCQGGADRTGMAAALWKLYKEKTNKKTATKELSIKFGHRKFKKTKAMDFFIDKWQGKEWLLNSYNPKKYPDYKD